MCVSEVSLLAPVHTSCVSRHIWILFYLLWWFLRFSVMASPPVCLVTMKTHRFGMKPQVLGFHLSVCFFFFLGFLLIFHILICLSPGSSHIVLSVMTFEFPPEVT